MVLYLVVSQHLTNRNEALLMALKDGEFFKNRTTAELRAREMNADAARKAWAASSKQRNPEELTLHSVERAFERYIVVSYKSSTDFIEKDQVEEDEAAVNEYIENARAYIGETGENWNNWIS